MLAAAGLAACATAADEKVEEPTPAYVRFHGPWVPETLDRAVVECTDEARDAIRAEPDAPRRTGAELRRAMRDHTTECMKERGWKRQ